MAEQSIPIAMAMVMMTIAFSLLPLLCLSATLPSQTVLNAAETLSDSGFLAMSLTLELISDSLRLPSTSTSTTIFCPPDTAFETSGQPSLSLLLFHFSPLAFSFKSLRSLPYGAHIPTLSPGNSLTVTTSPSENQISINEVKISRSPIFDDGTVIVFGIEDFFDPNFTVSHPIRNPRIPVPVLNPACSVPDYNPITSFAEASGLLRSRGHSVIASFLELQLLGFVNRPEKLTVFAPADEVMIEYTGNTPEYPSLFLRHVVPCYLAWTDLIEFSNGTMLGTYLDEFSINVTRSGEMLLVNEVPVSFPDMYYSDWLVVHGIHDILAAELMEPEDSSGIDGSEVSMALDNSHGEF